LNIELKRGAYREKAILRILGSDLQAHLDDHKLA
jgi:hypothetical protein